MTDRDPIEVTNLDGYGFPPLAWDRARDALATETAGPGVPYFLGTSRSDGRPHAAGFGALWFEGDLCFPSGPGTRKAHTVARTRRARFPRA